jgi:very-short-patch-repair endonuclease
MPNFQRQKSIDNFIADFYCRKAKLIIEIDGAEHFTEEGKIKDALRTEILEKYGLTVIRFTNRQTDKNFNAVCKEIDKTVKAKIQNN